MDRNIVLDVCKLVPAESILTLHSYNLWIYGRSTKGGNFFYQSFDFFYAVSPGCFHFHSFDKLFPRNCFCCPAVIAEGNHQVALCKMGGGVGVGLTQNDVVSLGWASARKVLDHEESKGKLREWEYSEETITYRGKNLTFCLLTCLRSQFQSQCNWNWDEKVVTVVSLEMSIQGKQVKGIWMWMIKN